MTFTYRYLGSVIAILSLALYTSPYLFAQESPQQPTPVATATPHISQPEIVGGGTVNPGDIPWQAQIFSRRLCGGSLLTSEWVVTSAKCVYGTPASKLTVVLGEEYLDRLGSNAQIRRAKQVVIHPNYNSSLLDNDISYSDC